MAENKLTSEFVMSDRISGKFLYVHEHDKFYTWAAEKKSGIRGQTYRCIEHTSGCKSRVYIASGSNECMLMNNWKPHTHTTKIMSSVSKN